MFPQDIQKYLNNEDDIYENNEIPFNGAALLFDFKKNDFVTENGRIVTVTGVRAVECWLEKLIRTKKFHFKVYENDNEDDVVDYAVTIMSLLGGIYPPGYIEAEIEREIRQAAVKNPYIDDLVSWIFEREGSSLIINFTVIVNDGESFGMEVDL